MTGLTDGVWEWFIRRRAGAEVSRVAALEHAVHEHFTPHAKVTAELARRAHRPIEPLPSSGLAVACDLYRQAIWWAARGVQAQRALHAGDAGSWEDIVLSRATALTGAGDLAMALAMVQRGSFETAVNLPIQAQARCAEQLRVLSDALVQELISTELAATRIRRERVRRIGGVALFLVLATGTGLWLQRERYERRDLAVGKGWQLSSNLNHLGCQSPEQTCAEGPDYFFHTHEQDNPWIAIDLGKPVRFSAVRIDNRRDCCLDRASPLLIEVSSDGQSWREVLRREGEFVTWRGRFSTTTARWVRARVPKVAYLHFAGIKVLP